ncbi:MAG: spore gernimation protein [Syntrophomonadaceae bacterium]|nr:spore gernimation protein [Syntrophomonadaceae bacterium]
MNRYGKVIGLLLLLTVLFLAAGCDLFSKDKDKDKNPVPAAKNISVVVYYPKDTQYNSFLVREIHTLKKTTDMPKTAVEELIKGTPTTSGAHKVLPAATKVLGVKIDDQGLATVDFSPEVLNANVGSSGEALGIASIVNTLTEFPNIIKVSFTVNGKAENAMDWWGHVGLYEQPFSRNMSLVQEPLIWVTSPVDNQVISSPLKIAGSAMVFEATVSYRLKDAQGNILASGFTNAAVGAPERGDYATELQFKSPGAGQKGQLEVFEVSMKDGSDRNKVIVPVVFK